MTPADPVIWHRLSARFLVGFLLCLATLLPTAAGADEFAALFDADPLHLEASVGTDEVVRHSRYLIDENWSLTPDEALSHGDFVPRKELGSPLRYVRERTWIIVPIENGGAESEWRLYAKENFKGFLRIHLVDENGVRTEPVFAGDGDMPFSTRPIDYPEIVAPISLAPGERAALLIAVWSYGKADLEFSVLTAEDFQAEAMERTARNYLFYGIMSLLISIAALCTILLRSSVFLAYCGYAVSALIYVMHVDGTAFQLIWPDAPLFNINAASILGAGIVGFGAAYARSFLRTPELHPRIDKAIVAVGLTPPVLIALLQFTDPQLLNRIVVVVVLVAILIFTLAGVVAARRRFGEVRFYLFAWVSAVGSATVLNLDHTFNVEFSSGFILDTMRAVLVFDAMMMGLAIADRYAQLRSSRESVMRRSLEEAERNAGLNRRLADLEDRYHTAVQSSQAYSERIRDTVHDLQQPLHALRLRVHELTRADRSDGMDNDAIEGAFAYVESLVSVTLKAPERAGSPPVSQPRASTEPGTGRTDDAARSKLMPLASVLTTIDSMFRSDAEAKGLVFEVDANGIERSIDGLTGVRIVSNLVQNAIRYTASGSVAVRACEDKDGTLRVGVIDTGPGLGEDEFERAKVRGERLAQSTRRTRQASGRATAEDGRQSIEAMSGHGFGLAIVAQTCAEGGHQLRLRRTPEGGAVIEVTFAPNGASDTAPATTRTYDPGHVMDDPGREDVRRGTDAAGARELVP